MKKTILIGGMVLGLAAGGSSLLLTAPELSARSKDFQAHAEERQQRRLDRLTEKLDLTADQRTKIKALFDDQRAKMKAIHEETRKKMMALLTPEQKAQLEKLHEEKGKKE